MYYSISHYTDEKIEVYSLKTSIYSQEMNQDILTPNLTLLFSLDQAAN
jgi:hypothetical protein